MARVRPVIRRIWSRAADPSSPQRPPLPPGAVLSRRPASPAEQLAPREPDGGLAARTLLLVPSAGARAVRPALPSPRSREGSMKCTDCHSPHGRRTARRCGVRPWGDVHGVPDRQARSLRLPGTRPSGSRAAPSVTRRTGRCRASCWQRRESRFVCLQCHGDPHADQPSVPHGLLGFQTRGDCTRCHAAIHGSNFSKVFLRRDDR